MIRPRQSGKAAGNFCRSYSDQQFLKNGLKPLGQIGLIRVIRICTCADYPVNKLPVRTEQDGIGFRTAAVYSDIIPRHIGTHSLSESFRPFSAIDHVTSPERRCVPTFLPVCPSVNRLDPLKSVLFFAIGRTGPS
jgi:hypothetical protein